LLGVGTQPDCLGDGRSVRCLIPSVMCAYCLICSEFCGLLPGYCAVLSAIAVLARIIAADCSANILGSTAHPGSDVWRSGISWKATTVSQLGYVIGNVKQSEKAALALRLLRNGIEFLRGFALICAVFCE